jgi:maleate isomerase
MHSHPDCKIGLVVPPSNTAVEEDFLSLGGDEFSFSFSRYSVYPGETLRERLDHYAGELPSRLKSFHVTGMNAIMACCSGNHYLEGFDKDLEDCRRASKTIGVPTFSTTVAVVGWLRHCGMETIHIVSPYADWLNDLANAYWLSAGLKITFTTSIFEHSTGKAYSSPYNVETEDILAAVRGNDSSKTPVLMDGTGMHTRNALAILSHEFPDRVFLTSNSCSINWLRLTKLEADPFLRFG